MNYNSNKYMSNKIDDIIRFIQIIQPIRVIEWKDIKIEKSLGEGSYGAVKMVRIPNTTKPLAMKILKLVECRNKEEMKLQYERIHREIQLLQSCSHPNILPLYGISINYDNTPFEIGILTPKKWGSLAKLLELLYTGQTTEENLPPGIKITNEIKQKIIFGISAGLLYLSTKNIIHRDIKPENILLDEDFNPLLCDFGFAKEIILKGSLSQSENFGTPLYEAPEIFLGEGKYNEKVDIYSWAIVINSILDEKMPWKELLEENPNIHPFIFFQNVMKGIRPQLIEGEEYKIYKNLIEKGWDQDPTKRPKAKEIIEILMKKEALLPDVNEMKMKEYEKEVLKQIPEYFMILFEKVEKELEEQKEKNEKQSEKLENLGKQLKEQKDKDEKQLEKLKKMEKELEIIKEKLKQLEEGKTEKQSSEANSKPQQPKLQYSNPQQLNPQQLKEKNLSKNHQNDLKSKSKNDKTNMQSTKNQDIEALQESFSYELIFKIVICGGVAGKTNLLRRFTRNQYFGDSRTTIGVEMETKIFKIKKKIIKAQIWDAAGAEKFRTIAYAYIHGADGILLLYDITNRNTYEDLNNWINYITLNTDSNSVVLLVGNKTDLAEQRAVSFEEGLEFAKSHDFLFIETSARDNYHVEEAFTTLISEIINRQSNSTENCSDQQSNSTENCSNQQSNSTENHGSLLAKISEFFSGKN